MIEDIREFKKGKPDIPVRLFHFGMMVFAVSAWLTGDWADDYKKVEYLGFTIHKWLGIGLTLPLAMRLLYGAIGPKALRFSSWVPWTAVRLKHFGQGLFHLVTLTAPKRPAHLAVAGMVQSLGLALFSWMATTGTIMFYFLEPGRKSRGLMHLVKEMHEVGESLIPVYLTIHIGAVAIHALYGRHIWRKMLFLKG